MDEETDSRNAAFPRKRAADEEPTAQSVLSKRPRSPDAQSSTFAGWNRGVKSNIRPSLGKPRLGSSQNVPPAANKVEPAGRIVKRSPSPSAQLRQDGPDLALTRARASVEPVVQPAAPEYSSSEEGEIESAFSGDDEAVVINVAGSDAPRKADGSDQDPESDLESGEISDDQGPAEASSDDESQDMDVSDGEPAEPARPPQAVTLDGTEPFIVDLDADDGSMMGHAPKGPRNHPSSGHMTSKPLGSTSTTLADIDLEELSLQLRYYHFGRDPAEIPLTELVRCLTCTGSGHMSKDCPELSCHHCGKYNVHFSADCDRNGMCSRCGQHGHDNGICESKLRATAEDLTCELCGCRGHTHVTCEARWRTTQFPPTALSERAVRMYCYECGYAGHLGNDCPSRQPGRPLGTSMWSKRTMPGGPVPASTAAHVPPPPPLSRRQQNRLEQARNGKEQSGPPLATNKAAKAKSAPIKIGSNIAKNRADLQSKPKENAGTKNSNKAPAPGNARKGGKKKKPKAAKSKAGPAAVRPGKIGAQKAFVRGKT